MRVEDVVLGMRVHNVTRKGKTHERGDVQSIAGDTIGVRCDYFGTAKYRTWRIADCEPVVRRKAHHLFEEWTEPAEPDGTCMICGRPPQEHPEPGTRKARAPRIPANIANVRPGVETLPPCWEGMLEAGARIYDQRTATTWKVAEKLLRLGLKEALAVPGLRRSSALHTGRIYFFGVWAVLDASGKPIGYIEEQRAGLHFVESTKHLVVADEEWPCPSCSTLEGPATDHTSMTCPKRED